MGKTVGRRVRRAHPTDATVHRKLQGFMYGMLDASEHGPTASKKCLDVMIELYRRRVWTDPRTVNVISDACFSPVQAIRVKAVKFFLGIEQEIDAIEDDEERADRLRAEALKANAGHYKNRNFSKLTRRRERLQKKQEKKRKTLIMGATDYNGNTLLVGGGDVWTPETGGDHTVTIG